MKINGSQWGDKITPWSWFNHSTAEADLIYGNGGWDWLDGGRGDDSIYGGAGNDKIYGGSGADWLSGGRGNDALNGGTGRDVVNGGAGDDFVNGGAGRDLLTGGAGKDAFVFDTKLGSSNVDTVTDFNGDNDKILLDQWTFRELWLGGLGEEQFHSGAGAFEGQDENDRIIYDTVSGSLYYDADGSGSEAAVRFAVLRGSPEVTSDDFLIV